MRGNIDQKVNARANALEASKVMGRTFLLLERDGSLTYCFPRDLAKLTGYKRILGQYRGGKAVHRYL